VNILFFAALIQKYFGSSESSLLKLTTYIVHIHQNNCLKINHEKYEFLNKQPSPIFSDELDR